MSCAATMTRNSDAFTLGIASLLCAIFVSTLRIASAQEPPKNFVFVGKPTSVPEITFDDAEGQARKLADFKGKVLLVNIWATWCGPCRKEMPALDRLQAHLGGSDFEVIPVSIDRGGMEAIRKFYSEIGVHNLAMYIDPPARCFDRRARSACQRRCSSIAVGRKLAGSSDRPNGTHLKLLNFSARSSRTKICQIEPNEAIQRRRIVPMRQA